MINNGMFLVIAILAIKNIMLLIIGNQFFFMAIRFMTTKTGLVLVAHKIASGNPIVHLT
jgi:hypothetical protein